MIKKSALKFIYLTHNKNCNHLAICNYKYRYNFGYKNTKHRKTKALMVLYLCLKKYNQKDPNSCFNL